MAASAFKADGLFVNVGVARHTFGFSLRKYQTGVAGHTVYILVHATQRELCEVVIERNIFPVNFPAFAVCCKLVVVFILVALGATCCQTLELLQGAPVGKGLKMTARQLCSLCLP